MIENCPLLKSKINRFKRKKAICATWENLKGSESEEDSINQDALICLTAMEETSVKLMKHM